MYSKNHQGGRYRLVCMCLYIVFGKKKKIVLRDILGMYK